MKLRSGKCENWRDSPIKLQRFYDREVRIREREFTHGSPEVDHRGRRSLLDLV